MNEHEAIRPLVALAAAGALDPAESMRVERHAEICEECRRELHIWRTYAEGLRQLPAVLAPSGLVERTHARILEQRASTVGHRSNGLVLGALAVFGWAFGISLWVLARGFTGGVVTILGANVMNGLVWSLVSAVVGWMTAATAVVMLSRRYRMGRIYETVA